MREKKHRETEHEEGGREPWVAPGPGGAARGGGAGGGQKKPSPQRPGRASALDPEEFDEDPVPEEDDEE